jgi:hypothetical protein
MDENRKSETVWDNFQRFGEVGEEINTVYYDVAFLNNEQEENMFIYLFKNKHYCQYFGTQTGFFDSTQKMKKRKFFYNHDVNEFIPFFTTKNVEAGFILSFIITLQVFTR